MAFKPSIQQLFSTGLTSQNGDVAVTDFDGGNIFLLGSISGNAAIKKTRIADGFGLITQDISSYSPSPATGSFHNQCMDVSGNVLLGGTGASNYCGVLYVNGADLSNNGTWGFSSGFSNYPNNVENFIDSAATWNGNNSSFQTYFVGATQVLSDAVWVTAGPITKRFIGAILPMDEAGNGARAVCSGPASISQGSCYVAAWGSPQQIGIYQIVIGLGAVAWDPLTWPTPNGAVSKVTLPKITPAMMGGGATTIACYGIVMDQTDGNLLLSIVTDVASYIAKYSVTTGAILWKNIVSTTPGNGGNMLKFSRIRHGKYCILQFFAGGARCYTIDTISGAMTSYTQGLGGLDTFPLTGSNQCFDDTTGALIFGCVKSNNVNGPTPLNGTPTAFSDWAALYVIEGFVDPVVPFSKTSYGRIWGNYV